MLVNLSPGWFDANAICLPWRVVVFMYCSYSELFGKLIECKMPRAVSFRSNSAVASSISFWNSRISNLLLLLFGF
jgi:hypothetical protein